VIIRAEHLPGVLAEIARLTTVEVAVAVARSPVAGQRIKIPARPRPGNRLAQVVGPQAMARICAELAGWEGLVPSARPFLRWYDARALRRAGATPSYIAQRLGVSLRWVQVLLQDMDEGEIGAGIGVGIGGGQVMPAACPACPACGARPRRARAPARREGVEDRQIELPLGGGGGR
jgi:hypothetical protein